MLICNTEIAIVGRLFRIAKLRHEWFEYLQDPTGLIGALKKSGPPADLLTFVQEAHLPQPDFPYHYDLAGVSLLTIKNYDHWWEHLHFKARNKARKAGKSGVEIRATVLDDQFAHGVERLYNESPLRQGRKFTHYGKNFATIKDDLSSFPERSFFIGAYCKGELIGFMKLFLGNEILRIIHILAAIEHRDKCVMDALIAHAVKMCDEMNIPHLHYGDWTSRGLGVFREKYQFQRHDCRRYFVPLNARGRFMLHFRLYRPIRDQLPQSWVDRLMTLRDQCNALRYSTSGRMIET